MKPEPAVLLQHRAAPVTLDDAFHDIARMGEAVQAICGIPTAARRRIAFDWLVARVEADIARLQEDEYIERVAALADAVLGENQ